MSLSLTAPAASLTRTTVLAGAAGAVATTGLAAATRAAGVHLAAHGPIPLAGFAQLTFAAALLGGLLASFLNRRGAGARLRFVRIALVLTALSCLVPLAAGDDPASKIGLVATHLLAAAIIVPVLARRITD